MFKREEDFVSTRPGEVHTLLGKGSEFEGKLTFEGQVRIDGKFNGQIVTKDVLVIGDGARVQAEIQAGTVIINGTVEGNVRATQLIELKQPGRVKGNLETPSLSMDRGVIFEGSLKMENLGKGGGNPPPPGEKK
nr:bactofilin BacM [Corallococcus sp. AS-1-12]